MIRCFYASIAAMNSNGFCISSFSFETKDGCYPTMLNVITMANERFPNLKKVQVISLTEMSESDSLQFKKGQ